MTTDPTDLRQRITDIATPFFANFSDEVSARLNAGELADVLAAVLPPLADRAAVLREAVERLSQVPFASVLTELRRLADEAQQPEPPVHGESVAHLAGLHDDEPAVDARQDGAQRCPAKHGALGRICELPSGHPGMHTGSGANGSAVWDGDAP